MAITSDSPNVRVRFEPETLEKLQRDADELERTVPAHIRWIVRDYYANQPIEEADGRG